MDFSRSVSRSDFERLCLSIFLGLLLLSLPHATSMDLTKEAENGRSCPYQCNPLPTKKYFPPDGWWIVALISIVALITMTFCLSKLIFVVRPAPAVVSNNELSAAAERLEERNRNMEKYYEYLRNTTHEVPIFRGESKSSLYAF